MPNIQAIAELLQQAEALLAQGEPRQAAMLLDKVLRLDFTNSTAWAMLHQMLGKGEPLEQFQQAFAQVHYPARAHLLQPPDLVPLTPVLIEPPADYQPPQAPPDGGASRPTPKGAEGGMCAYCGRYNPPGQAACLLCGAALTQPAQVQTSSPQQAAAPQPPPTSLPIGSASRPSEGGGKEGVPPPVNLICRACGNINRPPSRFCTQCGASLFNVDQPEPTPPQQVLLPSPGSIPMPEPPPASPSTGGGKEGVKPVILQAHEPVITPPQQIITPSLSQGRVGEGSPPPPPVGGGVACPNCHRLNPPGARLCAFCGYDFFYKRVVTAEKAKERPGFRFHFVDVGDLVVVLSLFLPWSFADGAFYTTYLLNVWGVIARQSCGPWIIAFIVLSLGASLLARAHHRLLSILAAIGSLISIIVVLDKIRGDEIGVYVALAGACLVLLGVIFFENEPLNTYVRQHRKNIIIAALALPLLLVLSFVVFGLVQDAQNTARIRTTSTAAAKTQSIFVAQRTADAGTKVAATQAKSWLSQTQTATMMTGEPWNYRVVYVLNSGGKSDIYTSRLNGNDRRQLTTDSKSKSLPKWSPDGRYIVYQVNEGINASRIYIMNSDGSGQRQLVNAPGSHYHPAWFPDSRAIVFVQKIPAGSDTKYTIQRINIDGSGMQQLVQSSNDLNYPVVSPDGKSLAYCYEYRVNAMETILVVTDINGKNRRDLTKYSLGRATFPVWSSDGKRILFSTQNIQTGIHTINQDGSNMQTILTNSDYFMSLSWSPNNKYIAYEFTRNKLYTQVVSNDSKQSFRPPFNANDLSFGPP